MNTLYFVAISINLLAFFLGNYFRWEKSLKVHEPVYNKATLLATIIVFVSLIAIVFLADRLIVGIVTAILMFVIINPVVSGILANIFMRDKQ